MPTFLRRYVREQNGALSEKLRKQIAWCDLAADTAAKKHSQEEHIARGRKILSWQREDGVFPFEPDGRHKGKDDFVVARDFAEPMGQEGDTRTEHVCYGSIGIIGYFQKFT